MLHFGALGMAGVGTHSDGDGVSDADEYAANTNPKDTTSYLKIASQSFEASASASKFVRSPCTCRTPIAASAGYKPRL